MRFRFHCWRCDRWLDSKVHRCAQDDADSERESFEDALASGRYDDDQDAVA